MNPQGQIDTLAVENNGLGYIEAPAVSISYPPTGIVEDRATATAFVSGGQISSIILNEGGEDGICKSTKIIIDPPSLLYDNLNNVVYSGDFGIITGVNVGSFNRSIL